MPDIGAKEALLADDARVYFTTPHFDGYPAILVRLDEITESELTELVTEAWLSQAPKRLAEGYLHGRGQVSGAASTRLRFVLVTAAKEHGTDHSASRWSW